jgi:hypothetical protein
MQSKFNVNCTFLVMSLSTTARHFPQIALEVHHAEMARAAQLRQQLACQVAHRDPAQTDLIPTRG